MTVNKDTQNFHPNPSNKNYANYHDIKSDMKTFRNLSVRMSQLFLMRFSSSRFGCGVVLISQLECLKRLNPKFSLWQIYKRHILIG